MNTERVSLEERPRPEFKFQAPTVRKPTQVDVWMDNAIAFASKLGKQLLLTLAASLFRAAADWLLRGSDSAAKDTLMNNMKGTTDQNKLYSSSAPSSSYNREYSPSYNRYRDGSETFPGF